MQGLEAELLVLDCAGASPQLLLNARVVNHGASAVTLNRMPLSFAMLVFDVRHKAALEESDPRARAQAFRDLQDETEEHWARILTGRKGHCRCARCRPD